MLPKLPESDSPEHPRELEVDAAETQARAVRLMEEGKKELGLELRRRNLERINREINAKPRDPWLRMVKGYTLKDFYQGTLGTLPQQQRDDALAEAETIFEALLEEDPANVGALNGFANVLFFWGRFEQAIEVFELARELSPPATSRRSSTTSLLRSCSATGAQDPGRWDYPPRRPQHKEMRSCTER